MPFCPAQCALISLSSVCSMISLAHFLFLTHSLSCLSFSHSLRLYIGSGSLSPCLPFSVCFLMFWFFIHFLWWSLYFQIRFSFFHSYALIFLSFLSLSLSLSLSSFFLSFTITPYPFTYFFLHSFLIYFLFCYVDPSSLYFFSIQPHFYKLQWKLIQRLL